MERAGRHRRWQLRKDKYKGWTVSLDGCDHPLKRGRMVYAGTRAKAWNRRISLAVALDLVAGSPLAHRYLDGHHWRPGRLGPYFEKWPVLPND
jgi:hypothetical protein